MFCQRAQFHVAALQNQQQQAAGCPGCSGSGGLGEVSSRGLSPSARLLTSAALTRAGIVSSPGRTPGSLSLPSICAASAVHLNPRDGSGNLPGLSTLSICPPAHSPRGCSGGQAESQNNTIKALASKRPPAFLPSFPREAVHGPTTRKGAGWLCGKCKLQAPAEQLQ